MEELNKNNINQWLDAFASGNLSETQEELLMHYLVENADLLENHHIEGITLDAPQIVYDNKNSLKKEASELPEIPLPDFLAIQQLEGTITPEQSQQLQQLIASNASLANDVAIYQHLKLKANNDVVLQNKTSLKRVAFWQTTLGMALKYSAAAASIALLLWMAIPGENQNNYVASTSPLNNQSKVETVKPDSLKIENNAKVQAKEAQPTIEIQKQPAQQTPAESIEPYLEPNDRLMASLQPMLQPELFEIREVNAYEAGLNSMMPLYLDNQIELAKLYALLEDENKPVTVAPANDNLSVKLLENGVKLVNRITGDRIKFSKYYDNEGNMVAYKLKGEGMEYSRKVK